jgi:hypothetical protein
VTESSSPSSSTGTPFRLPPSGSPAEQELAEQLVEQARAEGVDLVGPGGLLGDLTKRVLEAGLEAEMTDQVGYDRHNPAGRNGGNSRNGTRSKTVITEVGPVELDVPRDRDGSFEPKLVRKRQRRLGWVDEMVISLTAKGLTTGEVPIVAWVALVTGQTSTTSTPSSASIAATDATDHLADDDSRLSAGLGVEVRVDVERGGRVAVAEAASHGPDVHTGGEKPGGYEVAQVVQPPLRQTGAGSEAYEGVGENIGPDRTACVSLVAEHVRRRTDVGTQRRCH